MENNPVAGNPYAPTPASISGAAAGGSGFRDLSGISSALSILLLVGVAQASYELIVSLVQIHQGGLEAASPGTAPASVPVAALSLVELLLLFVTMAVFLRWIYVAQKNLPELGARYGRFSPGWAVGCYFVPFVNLWAPFQAMRDLAKASRNPGRWDLEDTPAVIVAWWSLWLLWSVLGRAETGMPMDPDIAAVVDLLYHVVMLLLYGVACLLVRRIWRDQEQENARQEQAGRAA